MSNGRSNLFGGIYYLPRGRKTSLFRFADGKRRGGGGGTDGSEDYIRSPRKRNIERNLIMSTARARACIAHIHAHIHTYAFSKYTCWVGELLFIIAPKRAEKDFSSRCGKQSREKRRNWETRSRVGRWEIIFPGFLASGPFRRDTRRRRSFVASAGRESKVHSLLDVARRKLYARECIHREWINWSSLNSTGLWERNFDT